MFAYCPLPTPCPLPYALCFMRLPPPSSCLLLTAYCLLFALYVICLNEKEMIFSYVSSTKYLSLSPFISVPEYNAFSLSPFTFVNNALFGPKKIDTGPK